MVGAAGFEPAALWSQTRCATKLRYAPTMVPYHFIMAGDEGIEPPLMVLETTVMPLDQSPTFNTIQIMYLRRRRDLNPRILIRSTPLAGEPLRPLEYFSSINITAERVGFEPTRAFTQTVFKTASL